MRTSLLRSRYQGTAEEARAEVRSTRGPARWLATPWPYQQLGLAALAVVVVLVVVLSSGPASRSASWAVIAIVAVSAAVEVIPAVWTLRHRDQAGRIMAARRAVSAARVRSHPLLFVVGVTAAGTVYGYCRPHHASISERLLFAALGAAVGLVVGGVRLARLRRRGSP